MQLALRRYPGSDASAAFAAHEDFDGTARAEIRRGTAWIETMLVKGPPLTREDRQQIAALMREHGAVELSADRHGRLVCLTK